MLVDITDWCGSGVNLTMQLGRTPIASFTYTVTAGEIVQQSSRRGEVFNPPPTMSNFTFSFFYFLTFLLTCLDRNVRRRNVVTGS